MNAGTIIERMGFASVWSNDHFYPPFGVSDGPVFEGWMTLAAWAVLTKTIPLGCLVSGAAYRNPALLVKMATALDHASHGRISLGLGAGWHEGEHRAFGYPLLSPRERGRRLADACTIASGLLGGASDLTFEGTYFRVDHARIDPPAYRGRRIPLVVGGSGERFTLPVVARYADVWNGEGDVETVARKLAILQGLCARIGRDATKIEVTVNLPTPCVRATRAEAVAAVAAVFARNGLTADDARSAAEALPCVGTAEDVIASLSPYAALGVQEVIFDTPHPLDIETLRALSGPIQKALSHAA